MTIKHRLPLILGGIAAGILILEVVTIFFFEKPQTILIENLNYDTPDQYASIAEGGGLKAQDIFYRTPTGLRLKKNVRGIIKKHDLSKKDVTFTTNSLGYRSNELGEKTENDLRILVLGDSITFAEYLPEKETFPYHIEQYLKKKPTPITSRKHIRVINAGVGMVGTENELAILMETGISVKPDVVVIQLYLNDAAESTSLKIIKPPKLLQKSALLNYLSSKLNLIRARNLFSNFSQRDTENEGWEWLSKNGMESSSEQWRKDNLSFNRLIGEFYHDWGSVWGNHYWQKMEKIFSLIRTVGKEKNFKLIVIFFPVKYQVESNLLRDEPQKQFELLMNKLEIAHYDLLPTLREKYQKDKQDLFYDHAHPKAEGMEFIGGEIGKFLLGVLTSSQ